MATDKIEIVCEEDPDSSGYVLGAEEYYACLHLEIDEDKSARLLATERHNSQAGSTLMRVYHRRDLEYGVELKPGEAVIPRKDALVALAEKLQPLVDRIRAGHEVEWDGSNMVGTLSADAKDAEEEVELIFERLAPSDWVEEGVMIWPADEWLYETRFDDIDKNTTDDELEELAKNRIAEARRDKVHLTGSVLEALKEAREELQSDLDCDV